MPFVKWILAAILTVSIYSSPHLFAQQSDNAKQAGQSKPDVTEKPKAMSPLGAVIDAFFAAKTFAQTAISPDGRKIAWVETLVGKDAAPDGNTAIYIVDRDAAAAPYRISAVSGSLACAEGSVAWSSDSQNIAFLSDAARSGQLQLYVASAAGRAAKRLTNVIGVLASPRWSPDSKTIAVLFTENVSRPSGPLVSEPHETGEIKDAFFEQRLAIVDVTSGEVRQLSPEDMYVYEYDWSPDGRRFVVTAAHGNGDNNWWIAQLYTFESGSLGRIKPLYKPSLQIARPVFSPDGERIAFIEGLMSDEDSVGGDVFTIDSAGGKAQNATPEMKASANWLAWTPDGNILFAGSAEGDAQVAAVSPSNGQVSPIWRGREQLSAGSWGTNISLAADGKTSAIIRSSLGDPPEIWAGTLGSWKQITHHNSAVKSGWGETRSIRWKSDGYNVQGWLTYPKDFDSIL